MFLNFLIISVILISLGIMSLFLSKGKILYAFILNFGTVLLYVLIPWILKLFGFLIETSKEFTDPAIFTIGEITLYSFSIFISTIILLFFPTVTSFISIGIYRILTLPKQTN